jgi:hypothetical protein
MRLIYGNVAWSRIVVLAWVSLWMLMVPLFHVHPEADHRHGDASHVHGGTVHTVFSQDLPCEFLVYHHASVVEDESRCPLHLVALPLHGFEHLEIDMVFASSAEPQVGKGTVLDVAAHSSHAPPPARLHAVWQPQPSPSLANLFLTTSLASRAPPIV